MLTLIFIYVQRLIFTPSWHSWHLVSAIFWLIFSVWRCFSSITNVPPLSFAVVILFSLKIINNHKKKGGIKQYLIIIDLFIRLVIIFEIYFLKIELKIKLNSI